MSYESGFSIALLLWLVGTVNVLVRINSRMERNLNKVGQRLSWATLTPKNMSAGDASRSTLGKVLRFVLIAALGLVSTFTSWLYVLLVVGFFAYSKSKDVGAPQSVKEFRWKLRNMDLSRDQVIKEMMKVSGQDELIFEDVRSELLQGMKERGLAV